MNILETTSDKIAHIRRPSLVAGNYCGAPDTLHDVACREAWQVVQIKGCSIGAYCPNCVTLARAEWRTREMAAGRLQPESVVEALTLYSAQPAAVPA